WSGQPGGIRQTSLDLSSGGRMLVLHIAPPLLLGGPPVFRPTVRLLATLLALAVLTIGILPAQPPSRAKEIADLEKQIAELTKKLNTLKAAPVAPPVPAQLLPATWAKALTWRCVGPASMGGRIVAFAVCENDPSTFWIATASGGLLKTTNNGVTFE